MFRKKITFSPLLLRLLTLNILALFFFIGGIFSIDRYQKTLEENEFQKLEDEGRILSQAIGRSIIFTDNSTSHLIITKEAQETISHLLEKSRIRIRLFSYQGDLIADSRKVIGYQTKIKESQLQELQAKNLLRLIFEKINTYVTILISKTQKLPIYQENVLQKAEDYQEVIKALYGDEVRELRQLDNGNRIFTLSLPVKSYRRISGAVLLSLDGTNVEEKLEDYRFEVFKIFFIALFLTICVSIYLSTNIVNPIRKLAFIAKNINPSKGRKEIIPQFADRKDEITDLATSLKTMLNSLWTRMDAIENFAADVSHEIKNPLTSLKSAIEVANNTKDRKKLAKLSKIILHDINRLDRLVTDISNASRLDAELSREGMKNTNLKKIILNIINFYNREKNIIVFLSDKKFNPIILANEDRLSQVFTNIVDNAISFNKKNKKIEIKLLSKGNFVNIYIDDFGHGINQNSIDKIFDRFYTERPQEHEFGQHSGLGLSISKQIIETHKGSIKVENRINKSGKIIGARFIIIIPKMN